MALSPQAQNELYRKILGRVYFYGTPEKNYLDSGIWIYLNRVKTKDEHDPMGSAHGKLLPTGPDGGILDYIKICVWFMLRYNNLAITKSRQIMMSWIAAIFYSWLARAMPNQLLAIQSKDEPSACRLVTLGAQKAMIGRVSFINHHLPRWMQDPLVITPSGNNRGHLIYSNNSEILAFASGDSQIRSNTPTRVLSDEFAFQPNASEAHSAILPAVHGGAGAWCGVSSANPGFMADMVLDIPGGDDTQVENIFPWLPHGMKAYRTNGGAMVLRVHYSANPAHDPATPEGRKWLETLASTYVGGMESAGFQREMEINWSALGGQVALPQLARTTSRVYVPSLDHDTAIKSLAIYSGFDWGNVNPSAFVVIGLDADRRIYTLDEIYGVYTYREMAEKIKSSRYYNHIRRWRADPSIWKRDQATATGPAAIAALFEQEGIYFEPGCKGADYPGVSMLLGDHLSDMDNPRLFLTPATPNTNRQLAGLRWKKVTPLMAAVSNTPEKLSQKKNHASDAFFYAALDAAGFAASPFAPPPANSIAALEAEIDGQLQELTLGGFVPRYSGGMLV